VLDLGCGWGELLLRILDAVPGAVGTGIDLREADLARGRHNAMARGLAGQVSFVEESAVGTAHGPADLVLCVGASHALSEASPRQATIDALSEMRRLVNPGGRVFFGECFWEHPPTPAELAAAWPDVTAEWHSRSGPAEPIPATLMTGCIPRSTPSACPRSGGPS
jgi:cyclopropane fatty-acyl-phospholipid synthase-like methyltransferase